MLTNDSMTASAMSVSSVHNALMLTEPLPTHAEGRLSTSYSIFRNMHWSVVHVFHPILIASHDEMSSHVFSSFLAPPTCQDRLTTAADRCLIRPPGLGSTVNGFFPPRGWVFYAGRIFIALYAPHTVLDGFTDLVAEGTWRLELGEEKRRLVPGPSSVYGFVECEAGVGL